MTMHALLGACIVVFSGCSPDKPKPPPEPENKAAETAEDTAAVEPKSEEGPTEPSAASGSWSEKIAAEPLPRTTNHAIALKNLNFSVDRARTIYSNGNAAEAAAALATALLGRTQILNSYDDFDEIVELEARLAKAGTEFFLQRAKLLAKLHRFDEAKAVIDEAEAAGVDAAALARAKASHQAATGRAAEGLSQREAAVAEAPTFEKHIALAYVLSELGRFDEADQQYRKALDAYGDVSPMAVAWTLFRRGMMWAERAGDAERGEALYRRALSVFPHLVTCSVHLAELEAENGQLDAAIARLRPFTDSGDPEPAGLLSELLAQADKADEAATFAKAAKDRYEVLLAKHRLAFADHGSEFFLGPGADPARARKLADANFAVRPTERARSLVINAAVAAKSEDLCELVASARKLKTTGIEIPEALEALGERCPE